MSKNFFKKIFLLIFVSLTLGSFVFAQNIQYEMTSYSANDQSRAQTPFFNLAFFNQPFFPINYQSFSNSFQFVFDLVIGASIALAVILFMVGAFSEIVERDNPIGVKKGKDAMMNAIIGLMIVLSTWLIINTINPDLIRLPMFTGLDRLSSQPQNSTQNSSVTMDPF
jgi:putative effector of murein hydrolase